MTLIKIFLIKLTIISQILKSYEIAFTTRLIYHIHNYHSC